MTKEVAVNKKVIWKSHCNLPGIFALAAGIAVLGGETQWQAAQAQPIPSISARVVAANIPGASAISQVGEFLNNSEVCAIKSDGTKIPFPHPIPTLFPQFTTTGMVLDQNRILVGSSSNFGAPLAIGVGAEGSFLSIDPSGPNTLNIPPNFAQSVSSVAPAPGQLPVQPAALGGAVQMFSANSPQWANGVNNPNASTHSYTGVSNPVGLSNNNAFGRLWPANAPFGDSGVGSSSILDPNGLPLAGAPSTVIGGVYVGNQTNRNVVVPPQPQVIAGSLSTGAVGTAFLGPSPDRNDSGTCRAVFAVVTADGAIVQEHTQKGLDGIAPAGTIQPLLGRSWSPPNHKIEPRLGVLMNPYTTTPGTAQLFVSEPFNNTIAVINLAVFGNKPNQVFRLSSVSRVSSLLLNLPVDLAPVQRDGDSFAWASNTTLDDGSDFYVANRGDNTIVRMSQNGTVIAVRGVNVPNGPLNNSSLNGIATSTDGKTIYVTVTGPSDTHTAVLALPTF
jgi:hypothetical protein